MGICINEALLLWFFFSNFVPEPLGCPGLLGLFVQVSAYFILQCSANVYTCYYAFIVVILFGKQCCVQQNVQLHAKLSNYFRSLGVFQCVAICMKW